jgi:hypothetical protein
MTELKNARMSTAWWLLPINAQAWRSLSSIGIMVRKRPTNGLRGNRLMNSNFPEEDLGPGIISGFAVTRVQFWGERMNRLLVCVSR